MPGGFAGSTAGYIAEAFVVLRPKADPQFGSQVSSEVKKAAGPTAAEFGRAWSTGITAPIVATGGAAAKFAIDFESAFAGVQKTVSGTPQQLGAIRQGIIDMSNAIPASREEIAGVAEAAGQLGVATDDVLGFTRTMIDLGNATNLTSTDAATQLARFMNIFQTAPGDVDNLGSSIVNLGNNFATTESEISQMGLRLAGAGSQLGATEADVLGISTALSSLGIQAQAGGSAISRTMIDLDGWRRSIIKAQEAGDELNGPLATMASLIGDTDLATMNGTQTLEAFIGGLQDAYAKGQNINDILSELDINELRQTDAIRRLVGGGDLLYNAIHSANDAWEQNNALQNEVARRYETTASKLQVLKNNFTNVLRILGEAFIPVISDALEAAMPFFDILEGLAMQFQALPEPARKLVAVILTVLAAIGPIVFVGAKVVSTFKTIGAGFKALGAAAAANPMMLALIAIAVAAFLIYKNWDTIKGWLKATWTWITEKAQAFADWFTGLWDKVATWVSGSWAKITGAVVGAYKKVVDTIVASYGKTVDAVTGWWDAVLGAITGAWSTVVDAVTGVWDAVYDTTVNVLSKVVRFVRSWWRLLIIIFLGPIGILINLIINMWDQISAVFSAAWKVIASVVEKGAKLVVWWVSTELGILRDVWDVAWSVISTVVSTAWDVITTVVSTALSVMIDVIGTGLDVLSAVWSAAWEAMSAVIEAVGWVIHHFVRGSIIIWQNDLQPALEALRAVFEVVWGVISSVVSTSAGIVKSVISTALTPVLDALRVAMTGLQIIWSVGWSVISTVVVQVKDVIIAAIDAIKQAAQDALGPLGDVIGFGAKVGGGALGGLVGAGKWLIGKDGGRKAGGGMVMPGRDYLVGEMGPEIVRFGGQANVIPAGPTATMLGSGQQLVERHVHFHIDGPLTIRDDSDITKLRREFYESEEREAWASGERLVGSS